MVDRNVTQVQVEVEYKDTVTNRQATQVLAEVEYKDTTTYRRASQIMVMVEYIEGGGPPPTGRVLGPAVAQM